MVSKLRIQRIAERIREELSEMMLQEVQDPRLGGISITDVTVDRELAFADVYVSSLDGSQRSEDILAGLRHAGGYLRSELASRVELRTFPRLRFHWDPTPERADHMEALFKSLRGSSSPQEEGGTASPGEEADENG